MVCFVRCKNQHYHDLRVARGEGAYLRLRDGFLIPSGGYYRSEGIQMAFSLPAVFVIYTWHISRLSWPKQDCTVPVATINRASNNRIPVLR